MLDPLQPEQQKPVGRTKECGYQRPSDYQSYRVQLGDTL